MHRYLEISANSAKEALIFNLLGIVVALATLVIFRISVYDSFGFIILIESTGLMLVGGALGVAGQATARRVSEFLTRRKVDPKTVAASDAKAALYALTGIILFAEGAAMSLILG